MAEEQLQAVLERLNERLNSQNALIQELRNNRNQIQDPFRIPDSIKLLQSFDGNKKQLQQWIAMAEITLNRYRRLVIPEVFEIYEQAIINKLEGKARDAIANANPTNFQEVKDILIDSLADRQEMSTYKYQLWTNKMEGNAYKYYKKHKELMQNIKTLAKQTPLYNQNWEAINAFIDEDALAAFISGLQKPLFGFVQAAKPANVEEAHAFVCKFISNDTNKKINSSFDFNKKDPSQNSYQKKDFNYKNKNQTQEPMDVDHSLRSKFSNNKKLNVHNTEVEEKEEEEELNDVSNDNDDSDSDSDFNINFWGTTTDKTKT
jgi:hypothetical protein